MLALDEEVTDLALCIVKCEDSTCIVVLSMEDIGWSELGPSSILVNCSMSCVGMDVGGKCLLER